MTDSCSVSPCEHRERGIGSRRQLPSASEPLAARDLVLPMRRRTPSAEHRGLAQGSPRFSITRVQACFPVCRSRHARGRWSVASASPVDTP